MHDDNDDDEFFAQRQVQLTFMPPKDDLSEVGSTAFLTENPSEQLSQGCYVLPS